MNLPDFSFEKELWNKGYQMIGGLDEVGRGCFAGPVVAGCVVFSKQTFDTFKGGSLQGGRTISIDDSKKLRPHQRDLADEWIRQSCLTWGIGEVAVSLINRIGMGKATKVAFRLAVSDANRRLQSSVDFLLIDAFYIPFVRGLSRKNQLAIVDGDAKSFSIAAASIIAKVHRDNL